jgi:hypothetical protein
LRTTRRGTSRGHPADWSRTLGLHVGESTAPFWSCTIAFVCQPAVMTTKSHSICRWRTRPRVEARLGLVSTSRWKFSRLALLWTARSCSRVQWHQQEHRAYARVGVALLPTDPSTHSDRTCDSLSTNTRRACNRSSPTRKCRKHKCTRRSRRLQHQFGRATAETGTNSEKSYCH